YPTLFRSQGAGLHRAHRVARRRPCLAGRPGAAGASTAAAGAVAAAAGVCAGRRARPPARALRDRGRGRQRTRTGGQQLLRTDPMSHHDNDDNPPSSPWRQPIIWLVIALVGAAVIGSVIMLRVAGGDGSVDSVADD